MLIKPEAEHFAKIKVVGVGGGGGNAVDSMVNSKKILGVDFIAINTDAQALAANHAPLKVQIGREITKGLGAGANPDIGKSAAEESVEDMKKYLEGSDMVFITAGLGGGTGTGAAPIIAKVAKGLGALTVGVVTKPFLFEGARRMQNAEAGLKELKDKVDALITIPNQKLLDVVERGISILDAFKIADDVLGQGVQGISDLIVLPGLVNVDFADVKTIMTEAGSALMGIGISEGENRAVEAAKKAVFSPLLDVDIKGATGILFNVVGGPDLGMHEVDDAARIISEAANPDANIIFGAAIDESFANNIKITVIATGFDMELQKAFERVEEREEIKSEMGSKDENTINDAEGEEGPEEGQQNPDIDTRFDFPTFLRRK